MPRILDLTIPLAPGVGHPMFRKVHIAPFHVHEIHRRSNADLYMAIHTATHIDAPSHFVAGGTPIDRIPLDRLIGEGVLFRVEPVARPHHRLSVPDLQGSLGGNGTLIFDKLIEMKEAGYTLLVVEQNAAKALSVAGRGYVLELGQNRFEGPGQALLNDPEVKRLYLGG